ncbi:hypothetical protein, partial [Pilosibacter fragilis]|uniref:hypothetical protein n=1 Tax=Pilosibacter fragilis TaxID=3078042 RepID=UPI0031BA98EE
SRKLIYSGQQTITDTDICGKQRLSRKLITADMVIITKADIFRAADYHGYRYLWQAKTITEADNCGYGYYHES